MKIKLPDTPDLDDWYVADTLVLPNDFDEDFPEVEWDMDMVSDLGKDQIAEYLGNNNVSHVELTWDGTGEHDDVDEVTTVTVGIFGPRRLIQSYWKVAKEAGNTLDPPKPATSLDDPSSSNLDFYESMKNSPTKRLVEAMEQDEWIAHLRAESEAEGHFRLSIDVDDEDGSFEKAYYRFVKRKAKKHKHAVNYGDKTDAVPHFKSTVHGGAVEYEMTFHTWQDAEEFLEREYSGGIPRDQWEDEGLESLEFYMYGEDPAGWK